MEQKQVHVLKQKQSLNLNQQQSLAVLSMSEVELNKLIQETYDSNPFLEVDWSTVSFQNDTQSNINDYIPIKKNIYDDLIFQLHVATSDADITRIGEFLIYSLNDKGYLDISLKEIINILNISEELLIKALKLVQSLEPAGVCARNLRESLYIQLKRQPEIDKLAIKIISKHFEELSKMEYENIADALDVPLESVIDGVENIRRLNPYPLSANDTKAEEYIYPELFVTIENGELSVGLNQRQPSVSLQSLYMRCLQSGSETEKQKIKGYISEAKQLISSIEQRQRTLLKVATYIINIQEEFFLYGAPAAALTQKDVANALGISISTVSRAVNDKHLQFNNKIYSLNIFFSPHLRNDTSREQIKDLIKSIINNENKLHPISDAQIARYIQSNGQPISRRTVTKYRDEMGISQVSKRRKD